MQLVLSVWRPELIEVFTGLPPWTFQQLVAQLERRGGKLVAAGDQGLAVVAAAGGSGAAGRQLRPDQPDDAAAGAAVGGQDRRGAPASWTGSAGI